MKTKLLFFSLLMLAMGGSLLAQKVTGSPGTLVGGDMNAASAACATARSCVWVTLSPNASSLSVTLSGTWSATVLAEQSADGGTTWTTVAASLANGLTTYTVTSMTDFRVRVSAYTSGIASVTLSVGLLQVQSVVAGGSSSASKNTIDGNDPKYGLFWDTVLLSDGVWLNNSPNVTSLQANFTSADIGKTFKGTSAGTGCGENQASNSVTTITGKIITVTDSHHVVLDTNSTAASATTACFAYGHLDDVGLTAMETAGKALGINCPTFLLPAGLGMMNNQHFNDKTVILSGTPCAVLPGQVTSFSGPIIKGQGMGTTGIVLGPAFNPANCTGGVSSNKCMGGLFGAIFRDFFVHGICDARTGLSAGSAAFFGVGNSDLLDHVILRCYGQRDTTNWSAVLADGSYGVGISYLDIDGFATGLALNVNPFYINNVSAGDFASGSGVSVGGNSTVFATDLLVFAGPVANNSFGVFVGAGSTLQVHNLVCIENLGTNIYLGLVNQGIANVIGGNCTLNGNTANVAILNQSGGKMTIQNLQAQGGATGADFKNLSGGTVIDQGFNTPKTPLVLNAGTWLGTGTPAQGATNTSVASRNTTLGVTTLVPTTANLASVPLTIKLYAYDSAAGTGCSTSTTVTWTINYTDPTGTAQTQTATETIASNTGNGNATGGDKLSTTFALTTNGNTAVTYQTTYAIGTCTTGPSYAAQISVQ